MSFYSPIYEDEPEYSNFNMADIEDESIADVPMPTFEGANRAEFVIMNVDRFGRRIQVPMGVTGSEYWTRSDVEQLKYLGKLAWLSALGITDVEIPNPVEWSFGIRKLAEYTLTGGNTPSWAAEIFNEALEMELPDPEYDGPRDEQEVRLGNVRHGSNPTHIKFVSKSGRWLGVDDIKGKLAVKKVAQSGDGHCSLVALMASGCKWGDVKTLNTNNIRVQDLIDFLEEKCYKFRIYDAAGRVIKETEDPDKHYMIAADHITAFKPGTRTKAPFTLFDKQVTDDWCADTWPLRGANTLEVDLFYNCAGIRAPRYTGIMEGNIDLDQCKAYPSVLLNPNNVFPIPGQYDCVNEYKAMSKHRSMIIRHGFYLVDLAFATDEERVIYGNRHIAWMYGDVMLSTWSNESFEVRGDFISGSFKHGVHVDSETLDAHGGPKILVPFTGCLEKIISTSVSEPYAGGPSEMESLNVRGQDHLDCEAHFSNVGITFSRTRHWKTTGRMAKLAIYQYTAFNLLKVWREVRSLDSRAVLCGLKTDCISVRTVADHHKLPSYGTDLGQFKVEKVRDTSDIFRMASESFSITPMATKPIQNTTMDKVLEDLKFNITPRIALLGPPGCGKTYNYINVLKPALEAKGITVKMATPLLAHVDRMIEKNVECESNAGFVTTHDFAMLRKSMRKAVMVIDEIGLATPHHFAALKFINPAGIILLGDHRQLSSAGDLLRIIQRLEVSVINLDPHANDRFNGCQGMRNVLKILEDEIDKQYAAGMHSSPGPGMWPGVELEKRLEAAGLRFVDDRTGDVVLGWRHKIVDPLGGKTVHSTQGDTITDTIFVADYKCDPRLLYTAISRSVLLSNVSVQRSCTTYNANGT